MGKAREAFGPVLEFTVKFWANAGKALSGLAGELVDGLRPLAEDVGKAITGGLSGLAEGLTGVLSEAGKAVSEGLSTIGREVSDALGGVVSTLDNLGKSVASSVAAIPEELSARIRALWAEELQPALYASVSDALSTLRGLLDGVGQIARPLGQAVEAITSFDIGRFRQTIEAPVREATDLITRALTPHSPLTPDEAYTWGTAAMAVGNVVAVGLAIASILAEAATFGQVDQTLLAVWQIPALQALNAFALEWLRVAFQAHIAIPLRRWFYRQTRPRIPDDDEAVRMFLRGLLDEARLRELLALHGWPDEYVPALIANAYRLPTVDEATRMLWRGLIDDARFAEFLKGQGVPPELVSAYRVLAERIPGPADLVRFVVREVITPEDFAHYMAWQGYSAFWADAYWEAHWQLPSPERLWQAFLRGVITEDEYRRYIVWHDYRPEPRPGIHVSDVDIVYATQYDLPGRIDIRWMYRWGEITLEQMKRLIAMTGLDPKWLDPVVRAYAKQQFESYVKRLEANWREDFTKGYIDEATLRANLATIGYPEELIELVVADALEDRERRHREELLKAADEAYVKEELSDDEYRALIATVFADPRAFELHYIRQHLRRYKKLPKGVVWPE